MGLCLLVGVSGAGFTASSLGTWFHALAHPPGTPPDWAFVPVWTVLYALMGVSAWLVWRGQDVAPRRTFAALRLWGWQLLLSAAWTPVFFGLHRPMLSLVVIVLVLALIVLTIAVFHRLNGTASALLVPYAAWVAYATYLNAGFLLLN